MPKNICIVAILAVLLSGCVVNPPLATDQTASNTQPAENAEVPSQAVATTSTDAPATAPLADAEQPSAEETQELSEVDETELFPRQTADIWNRIRYGFELEDVEHKRIDRQLSWYVKHPEYLQRVSERARPYMHYILNAVEEYGAPTEIALLPIVESAFQPFAYSHGRAAGIWQFIPSTGKLFGLKQNWWYDGRRDVYASTHAALKLLTRLADNFNGDWMLALAAYNSGEGTVLRAIKRNKRRGKPTDFFSLDLPKETRAYVPKLLALRKIVDDPEKYGVEIDPIPDMPYFEKVSVDSQIDLALVAELAEMPLEEIYQLNPGYNRWATAPNGPHHLLLPIEKADLFNEKLEELPPEKRIRWIRHTIKQGETLSTIAQKYRTSISTIKRINHIRGVNIRVGHGLTIPVASLKPTEYTLSESQRRTHLQNIPRSGTKIAYIVKEGDTFWDLARYHRVNVRQLAKWNSMAPRDRLQAGQKLIIWSRRSNATSSASQVEQLSAPPQRQITKRIGYRVRIGDSLARIAQKFRVTVNQLLHWNKKLESNKYLQPGQLLTLFVDVTRQSSS